MTTPEIILAIFATLGLREVIGIGWRHYLGKRRSDAETDGIHLSNTGLQLADLREAMALVGRMRREMEQDKQVIAELKDSKIEDDRRLERRAGVIEEQRAELRSLHEEVAELRVRHGDLEKRVETLERENKELMKENLQLKGMAENASQLDDSRE